MTDAQFSAAALVEVKLTTRGLKGYTPSAGSHWANVLDLLGQVAIDTKSRDMAVSELRMTTVGYDYYVKKGATPGTGSHWGKALAYIAEIGVNLKVTVSAPAGTLSGTVTVSASATPSNQASTITRVEFYVDSVLKATDTTAPYSFSWNTTTVLDGTHQLKAKAFYPVNKYTEGFLTVMTYNTVAPPPPPPPQAPPVNSTLPTISGTATQGQTLTVTNGSWTNSPTSYPKQWLRCDAAGANSVPIPGAINSSYILAAADVGATIRCTVTAMNSYGSTQATTVQTAVVGALAAAVPTLQTAPVIVGTAIQGNTLSVTNGAWSNSPTSYTHCWIHCDSAGNNPTDIVGQAPLCGTLNNTFVVSSTDVGFTIKCYTTATNATGDSTPALTAATTVVTGTPPPPPPPGIQIRYLSDFVNASFTDTMVNRWGPPGQDNSYQPLSQTGPAWGAPVSGPCSTEISTPYGPGFRFISNTDMYVSSGGKKCECGDFGHYIKVGVAQTWGGKVMFPASGNTQGFPGPNNGWNLFWEIHEAGQGLQFGVNTDSSAGPVPCLYFVSLGSSWGRHQQFSPSALQLDRWYDWRLEIKLSSGSDGYTRAFLDGASLGSWGGANMELGQSPYLQLGGIYGQVQYSNEVLQAGLYVNG